MAPLVAGGESERLFFCLLCIPLIPSAIERLVSVFCNALKVAYDFRRNEKDLKEKGDNIFTWYYFHQLLWHNYSVSISLQLHSDAKSFHVFRRKGPYLPRWLDPRLRMDTYFSMTSIKRDYWMVALNCVFDHVVMVCANCTFRKKVVGLSPMSFCVMFLSNPLPSICARTHT